jgi:hypothetical protein
LGLFEIQEYREERRPYMEASRLSLFVCSRALGFPRKPLAETLDKCQATLEGSSLSFDTCTCMFSWSPSPAIVCLPSGMLGIFPEFPSSLTADLRKLAEGDSVPITQRGIMCYKVERRRFIQAMITILEKV